MRKHILAVVAIVALGLSVTACGREVDSEVTGAEDVPGAHGLKRFCDQSTLIYFSDWDSSDDDYEWFYPGGCVWDEKLQKWVFANPSPQPVVGDGDATENK